MFDFGIKHSNLASEQREPIPCFPSVQQQAMARPTICFPNIQRHSMASEQKEPTTCFPNLQQQAMGRPTICFPNSQRQSMASEQKEPTTCFPNLQQQSINCSHQPSECGKQRPIEIHHHHYYYYYPPQWNLAPPNFPQPPYFSQTPNFYHPPTFSQPPTVYHPSNFPQPPNFSQPPTLYRPANFPQPPNFPRPAPEPPVICRPPPEPPVISRPPFTCPKLPEQRPPFTCPKMPEQYQKTSPHMDVIWKSSCLDDEIPPGAVRGGTDIDGEPIYVGRAYHEGDCLPAKVIPGRKCCYVSYGGCEHAKTSFEVLCETLGKWVPCKNGEVQPNAIEGGKTSDGETLYIGRVCHQNSLTVGKIHPSHRTCYIPFDGKEISCPDYEVLLYNPKADVALHCCGHQERPEYQREETLSEEFFGFDSPNEVWRTSSLDKEVPYGTVRGGTDVDGDPIYVGRAFHNGDCLPANIIPGKKLCYVSYNGAQHAKTYFQVFCEVTPHGWLSGEDGEVPPAAVRAGNTADGELLYIGRVQYKNSLIIGKIHPSHRTCYIPFDGKEISCRKYQALVDRGRHADADVGFPSYGNLRYLEVEEERIDAPLEKSIEPETASGSFVIGNIFGEEDEKEEQEKDNISEEFVKVETRNTNISWKDSGLEYEMPPGAVQAGTDLDGSPIYVGRSFHAGDWMPAKVVPRKSCFISYGGLAYSKQCFQVLCAPNAKWVLGYNGKVPPNAIKGGKTSYGEVLYIGRVNDENLLLTVGKIHPSYGLCYIPYGAKEISYPDYEVLVSENDGIGL